MRFYIKVRNKLGVEPKMIHNELKLFDSVHAPSLKTIYNWIKDFNNNRESLEDKPRSGRPISESTPQNIELVRNVIEENPYINYEKIQAETFLSYGTVQTIVKDKLKMKKIASRWVPHQLSEKNKLVRLELCKENLEKIKTGKWRLCDIVTGDESWFYHRHISKRESTKSWVYEDDEPRTLVRRQRFEPKTMFSIFFRRSGLVHLTYMDKGTTIDTEKYIEHCIKPVIKALYSVRMTLGPKNIKFHHDNARPHVHQSVVTLLNDQKFVIMKHPPYSPDLAPCDFWLFDYIKSRLGSHNSAKSLKLGISRIIESIDKDEWIKTFDKWVERMEMCISVEGDYFEHLLK